MRQSLPAMDPAENPVIEFDFAGELPAIDQVLSVEITPGGATLLDGAPQIVGTSVLQRIKPDITNIDTNYTVRCVALGGTDRRVRAATLPVRRA